MFVYDDISLEKLYDGIDEARIIGVEFWILNNDTLYLYITTGENSHFLVSIQENESDLDLEVINIILNSILSSTVSIKKILLTSDSQSLYRDLSALKFKGSIIDFSKDFYNIKFLYNNLINKYNNNLINKYNIDLVFLKNQIIKLNNNNFKTENKFYTYYNNIYRNLLKNKEELLRILFNNTSEKEFLYMKEGILKKLILTNHISENGINFNYQGSKFFNKLKNNSIIYPKYNIYTPTGRLSSTSDDFNCLAIPKGLPRKEIITKYDRLIYFDYIALHPRLCLQLLQKCYKIPSLINFEMQKDIYKQLSEIIDNKVYNRDEMKFFIFKFMYGKIDNETALKEPFLSIFNFSEFLFTKFQIQGFLITPLFNNTIYFDKLLITHSGKLLANFMQSIESDVIALVGSKIKELLEGKKSQIIGYFYDGLLMDMPSDEFELIKEIKQLFENIVINNIELYLPISIMAGINFEDLRKLG